MGTWIGHTAPGIFFICLSTWWAMNTSYRYIRANYLKNKNNENDRELYEYRGSMAMPCLCFQSKFIRRLPIESLIKFVAILTQVICELVFGSDYIGNENKKHFIIHEESLHHVVMFSGFMFAAFVEILVHYGVSLPKKTVYVVNLVSGIIFVSTILLHLDGRDMIDQHLHKLFGIAACMLLFAFLIELHNANNYWGTYGRSYFLFVIGTWLIQIAFTMWPLSNSESFKWNPLSKRDMSLITFSFGVHLLFASVYFLMLHLIVHKYYLFLNRYCFKRQDYGNGEAIKTQRYEIILNDITENEGEKLCKVDE